MPERELPWSIHPVPAVPAFGAPVQTPLPLGAHYFVHAIAAMQEFPASCKANLVGCRLVSDEPYPEICILAVVTAGTSVIGALGIAAHSRRSGIDRLTVLLMSLSITACVAGFGLYALSAANVLNESWARRTG